jgi:hypothetical protein
MKINSELDTYIQEIDKFLNGDLKYCSFRMDEVKKNHRLLYYRLHRKFHGDVPVKLVTDGNMLWIIRRYNVNNSNS